MTTIPAEIALARRPSLRDAGLWLAAGMIVLSAHAAFAYLVRDIDPVPERDALEEAMEIDLAPIPVSVPETVQSEALAREQPIETIEPMEEAEAIQPDAEQIVETLQETVRAIQPEPEVDESAPEPERVKTAEAVPEEPEPVETETVEAVTPEVAIPLPKPRPERLAGEKPVPKMKPVRRKAEAAKRKSAPPKRKAAPPASQASATSQAPKIDPSRWNRSVRAAIARRAGAVRGMRGTVRVSFVVNASGAIVSASVSGSSGNARLDRAALGMVRSARVPAPPAGLDGSRHAFAIPLSFR